MKKDNLEGIFSDAAATNKWGDRDSLSGTGSNLNQTRILRQELPKLVSNYNIKSMLDAPCGDFFWMGHIVEQLLNQLDSYVGVDVVKSIVDGNKKKNTSSKVDFLKLDITKNELLKVDLIFTRDCFIHLSYRNIYRALRNYKKSGSKYLLLSTYTNQTRKNSNIRDKGLHFRALNMEKYPFYFPSPIKVINEECTEEGNYSDKSMGLWKIDEINIGHILIYTSLSEIWMLMVRPLNFVRRVCSARWLYL